jgi:bisanhydrobacterioruberin hydratase
MEGATGLKLNPHESTPKEQTTLIIIIILFHIVGLIGFAIPSLQPLFLKLVPWHILLMLIVIVCSHRPSEGKFLLFALLIFLSSFILEWIGVHKHWVFGEYSYGPTLGIKIDAIPLIIGVNWFLLIYSAGVLMQRTRIRSIFIRVITSALLLVLLDLLIEPVAQHFDYWHWANNTIPIKNYISWFLVSGVMLFVFEKFGFKKQSIVAPVFLLVQFVFFLVLWLM